MKVIHIFSVEKFLMSYYQQIYNNFDAKEHHFVVHGEGSHFLPSDNAKQEYHAKLARIHKYTYINSDRNLLSRKVRNLLRAADKIIIHGMSMFSLLLFPYAKKCYIVFWGHDIYDYLGTRKRTIKAIAHEWVRARFIERSYAACVGIEGDYRALEKVCNPPKMMRYQYNLSSNEEVEIIEKIRVIEKSTSPMYIQVGNSASESNCHHLALEALSKFKHEDIRILCPLNYGCGGEKYVNEVTLMGKDIFGDKFEALTEYLSFEQYCKLLCKCRVAVFAVDRQQAFGNIILQCNFGAKIFMRSDTSMWDELVVANGMKFYDVDTISEMSFDDFICYNEQDAEHNRREMNKRWCKEKFIEQWTTIFKEKIS